MQLNTTYQMTKNLHINTQNLDGLSEKSDWASISGASPRKELLLELIKTAKTYSRQLKQLSEEVLLEVKKLVDEYCTASAAIKTGENRPHESV